ncbi:MAG: orotate phosphoribosyltransferase [Proteobacteria bacterium]|uniref:orotate phosphoribosyltransferase n=1 Tax=Rudaea sp. TaxID=2136325 RepID=UPI001D55ED71|nr:orotate phosphoribosyltransferase [Pseudomonadota bacterium]MBS0566225.1 orotate phosphoribosyltransferase [Pseudomonadota bacterium]
MLPHQQSFLDLALAKNALRFGEFTLKSGRVSPYFFNAGMIDSGAALSTLGHAYAQTALASGIQFDMLFGPAYKGIPLATATAIALADATQHDVPVAFNRKEAKTHGEGGVVIGAPLKGRVLVVDDVITAGTAIRESLALIAAQGATAAGILIALDRQERGRGALSAVQEVEREFGVPVIAIARLAELFALIDTHAELDMYRERMEAYRRAHATAE